ncbi:thermonuclease family protein [Robertmurraya sp. P23]|uniref:thermonuclease family protein n=1 Tax=Robertmurraya sp. P23 TaxID=3436931 RepID=UPI003D952D9A
MQQLLLFYIFLYFSTPLQKENITTQSHLQLIENKVNLFDSLTTQIPVTLIEPVDGDTIKVLVNGNIETVRYLLIDTPESKNPNMCVQLYAKEAYLRNSQLVKSGKLTLEFEQGNTRDSYGRLLAYVFVNGESIQGTLLKEGYARVAYVLHPPYKYLELFREDERLAKREKVNIWSRFDFVTYWGYNGCLP